MAWVRAVESGVPAAGAASAWDGYWATLVAEAAVRALAEGRRVEVEAGEAPGLYRWVGGGTVDGDGASWEGTVRAVAAVACSIFGSIFSQEGESR